MTRKRKILRRTLFGLGFVGLFLGLWAFWLEPASLNNSEVDVMLSAWPQECSGMRVAVLADLHVGSPFNGMDKLARIVDLTNAARPDLVLLAGDYVISNVPGGEFVEPETVARELKRLTPAMGTFAVLGNHDWWYGPQRVMDALIDVNITVLEDSATELVFNDCRFWIAGISDYWEGEHNIGEALAVPPEDALILALTHNPDVFPDVPARVALTFAGHTHGGQVYLPLVGRPIVPSEFGERYAIGHIVENGRHLFVSSGLGTSILPVRFLVPPEVSIVVIKSEQIVGARTD